MSSISDVVIVGAGVIGLSTAWQLAKRGQRVTVLDRSQPGSESSWAGAGIVPPGRLDLTTHPMDRLRAYSSQLLPEWASEIESLTGLPTGYQRCGGLELFDVEPVELVDLWRQENIVVERLTAEKLTTLCPNVLPRQFNYYFPTMAQIRNPWYLRALLAVCHQAGVVVCANQEVTKFCTTLGKVTAVQTAVGDRFEAKQFLLAPGAWGGELAGMLKLSLPVTPVRGQIVLFQAKPGLLLSIVSIGKHYFVPRADGRILVGASERPEAAFDKVPTTAEAETLIQFAYANLPALRNATIEKTWAGLRPGSPNGIPYIGRLPQYDNVFFAGGHYRAGIQLSPGTALATTELLMNQSPWLDLSLFRLDRIETSTHVRPFQS